MNKIFIFFVLSVFVFAKAPLWSTDKNIVLKKDQIYEGKVYQGHLEKPLKFRWTLYKNFGLVVLLNYDKFPYQFILYKDYQRDTFKLKLFDSHSISEVPYLYLSFKDFDEKNNTASLWLGISGDAHFLGKE